MADTPVTQQQAAATDITGSQVAQQILSDVELGKQAAALIDKHDMVGLVALAMKNRAMVEQQVKEVSAAIPAVKSGWKTTEFWVVVVYLALNVLFAYWGKPLPMGDDITVGSIVAAYVGSRHLIKTNSANNS